MKLEITKERVLKAAEKCGDAKNILTELFPEVFEMEFKLGVLYELDSGRVVMCSEDSDRLKGCCVHIPKGVLGNLGTYSTSWVSASYTQISTPFK